MVERDGMPSQEEEPMRFWCFYEQGPAMVYEAASAKEAAEQYAESEQTFGIIHVASETEMFRRRVTVEPSRAQTVEGPGYRVTLPEKLQVPER